VARPTPERTALARAACYCRASEPRLLRREHSLEALLLRVDVREIAGVIDEREKRFQTMLAGQQQAAR